MSILASSHLVTEVATGVTHLVCFISVCEKNAWRKTQGCMSRCIFILIIFKFAH